MINSGRDHNHVARDYLDANPTVVSALIRKQNPSVNSRIFNLSFDAATGEIAIFSEKSFFPRMRKLSGCFRENAISITQCLMLFAGRSALSPLTLERQSIPDLPEQSEFLRRYANALGRSSSTCFRSRAGILVSR